MIDRLAALSADAVAPLLVKSPASRETRRSRRRRSPARRSRTRRRPRNRRPVRRPRNRRSRLPRKPSSAQGSQESGRLRVAVRRVTGAPGDGATALARAVTSVLRQQDLTIVEPGGKADFVHRRRGFDRSGRAGQTARQDRVARPQTRTAPSSARSARKTMFRAACLSGSVGRCRVCRRGRGRRGIVAGVRARRAARDFGRPFRRRSRRGAGRSSGTERQPRAAGRRRDFATRRFRRKSREDKGDTMMARTADRACWRWRSRRLA